MLPVPTMLSKTSSWVMPWLTPLKSTESIPSISEESLKNNSNFFISKLLILLVNLILLSSVLIREENLKAPLKISPDKSAIRMISLFENKLKWIFFTRI